MSRAAEISTTIVVAQVAVCYMLLLDTYWLLNNQCGNLAIYIHILVHISNIIDRRVCDRRATEWAVPSVSTLLSTILIIEDKSNPYQTVTGLHTLFCFHSFKENNTSSSLTVLTWPSLSDLFTCDLDLLDSRSVLRSGTLLLPVIGFGAKCILFHLTGRSTIRNGYKSPLFRL